MSGRASELPIRTFPLIFAAPSGAGKTSIAQALRARRDDVVFSISATTRPARSYERDGIDYFFVSEPEFRRMAERGEMLEWAEVHGNLYGTPRRNLEEAQARNQYLLLDIDVQGSRQVREKVREAVAIFVLPPSGEELARRLIDRGSEDAQVQQRRLRASRAELAAAAEFDYVIVNHSIDDSVAAVERILEAESYRALRIPSLPALVERLCAQVDRLLEPDGPGNSRSHEG